jgi:hypothetical protein
MGWFVGYRIACFEYLHENNKRFIFDYFCGKSTVEGNESIIRHTTSDGGQSVKSV